MGQISYAAAQAAPSERDGDQFSEAAAEAFKHSPTVELALQGANVDINLVVSLFKSGFCYGAMHGYQEAQKVFDKVFSEFANAQKH